jgi:heat shock protein HtpX
MTVSDAAKVLEQLGGVPVEKPRAPFLHSKVERLSAKAGIGKPLVYVIPQDTPNACAVALSKEDAAIAVTTGLVRHLDENEIEAVLAHEIGHIQKDHSVAKTAVAARAMGLNLAAQIGGQLIWLSDIDFTPGDDDADDVGSQLIKALVTTVAQTATESLAASMQSAVSFDSEFEADECGGALSRKPRALASALGRIEQLTMKGETQYERAVSQLFIVSPAYLHYQTHPATNSRIERLTAMKGHLPKVASVTTVFCSSCGDKTDADGKYCSWCGDKLDT